MSEDNKIPYIRWGDYKSTDPNNPDILNFRAIETKTFDSELTVNVRAILEDGDKETELILSLASHASANKKLLKEWTDWVQKKKIRVGTKFQIRTYLGISKNKQTIRRYDIIV